MIKTSNEMSIKSLARVTKTTRNLEKPRPLKLSNLNRHTTFDGSSVRLNSVEEIMHLIDMVSGSIANGNIEQGLQPNIINMCSNLKAYGQQLETIYKDQLDRAFVNFRNGCREEQLDVVSRLHLLEIIELRAMQWQCKDTDSYYKQKLYQLEAGQNEAAQSAISGGITPTTPNPAVSTTSIGTANTNTPTQTILNQGEVVKPSGKYSNPTKIPNKNYYRDEVVIRNSDSGKVMGIKGRRVHMIEELSETIISFQRVHPGAKERLVQITGPNEDKIIHATQLIEETIRRNASPTRSELPDHGGDGGIIGGSAGTSINSSASEDNILRHDVSGAARRAALAHSYSTNDANIGEYKYTVSVGSETIKIIGTNFDLVWAAKLSLDDLFSRGQVLGGGDGFTNMEDDVMATSSMDLGRGNGSEGVQSQRLSVGGGGGEGTGGSNRRKDDDDSGATTSDSSEGTYVETPVLAKVAGASEAAGEPTKVLRSCLSKTQNKNADDVDLHTSSEDGAGTSDLAVKQVQQKLSPVAVSEELKKQPESKLPSRPTKIRYTNDFLLKCALSPLSRIPPSNWENISSQYPSIVRKVLLPPPPLTPFPLPRSVVNPPKYSYSWNPHMLMCPVTPVAAPLPPNPFYWKRAQY